MQDGWRGVLCPGWRDHLDDLLVAVPDRVALEVGSHVGVETTDEVLDNLGHRESHRKVGDRTHRNLVLEACTEKL